jgi:hypothetical protein
MFCCIGASREKKMIVVEDQEVVITVKGKNVTFRMSTSSNDRDHLSPVPESPKRAKAKRSFESGSTNSSRSAFDARRSREYEVSPYPGHTRSAEASVGRTPHRDPFAETKGAEHQGSSE